jgi:hypothetical protein
LPYIWRVLGEGPGAAGHSGEVGLATDYLLVLAAVGAWAVLTIWVADRHQRRVTAAFGQAVSALGEEAEQWLREQSGQ